MYDFFEFESAEEEQEYYKLIAFRELCRVLRNNFLNLRELSAIEVASGKGQMTLMLLPLFKKIVAIDPELTIEEDYENLAKEKKYFHSSECNCSNYDILVSCTPCMATEEIIYASKRYDVPFFIILCNCKHGFNTKEEWYINLKTKAESATLYKGKYEIWYLTNLEVE